MTKKLELSRTWRVVLVFSLRIITGATFICSGFTKAVDPWGSMYKIEEYLEVWGLAWVPREFDLCVGSALSLIEFTIGVALLLGCLRRVSVMAALSLMAVMLPLSIYIAVANPVADCGCFGDAFVVSNTATMLKNIVLTIMLIALYLYNHKVEPLVTPLLQWMPLSASILLCIVLSSMGYLRQPLVDFRPYRVGSPLLSDSDRHDGDDLMMVYERDGVRESFALDNLPDSTWTFVGRLGGSGDESSLLSIYDGDEEVTDWAISDDGPQLLLIVSNPAYHNRARASMANRLSEYMAQSDGDMIGLLPLAGEEMTAWREIARPNFETYTVESTVLKEIARGDAALVYLLDGIVQWKYNLYCLPGDFNTANSQTSIDAMQPIEKGRILPTCCIIWMAIVLTTLTVSQARRIKFLKDHKNSNIIS